MVTLLAVKVRDEVLKRGPRVRSSKLGRYMELFAFLKKSDALISYRSAGDELYAFPKDSDALMSSRRAGDELYAFPKDSGFLMWFRRVGDDDLGRPNHSSSVRL